MCSIKLISLTMFEGSPLVIQMIPVCGLRNNKIEEWNLFCRPDWVGERGDSFLLLLKLLTPGYGIPLRVDKNGLAVKHKKAFRFVRCYSSDTVVMNSWSQMVEGLNRFYIIKNTNKILYFPSCTVAYILALVERDKKQTMIDLRGISTYWSKTSYVPP